MVFDYLINYIDFSNMAFQACLLIIFAGMVIGTYTDFKKREVPDWVNIGLIFIGFGVRLIYSGITNDWMFTLDGIVGFVIFLILAYILFYTGQWGGGDSKMLIAVGVLLGVKPTLLVFSMSLVFFINSLIVGAFYGIIWSAVLSMVRWKSFSRKFSELWNEKRKLRITMNLIGIVILLLGLLLPLKDLFVKLFFFIIGIMCVLFYVVWIYMKAVEKSAMYKYIDPEQLVEGDWIVEDIYDGKKKVVSKDKLGIELEDIDLLLALKKKKKLSKVLVKEGIPFVPSFLVSLIVTAIWGNLVGFIFIF